MVHDFVLAGRFVVVFLRYVRLSPPLISPRRISYPPPLTIHPPSASPYGTTNKDLFKSLLGLAPLGATYEWCDDEPTRALVFAKDTLELVHDVPFFPPVSNYHFVNG